MNTASDYIAHGFALVPIPKGQKGPNTPGWNKRENVITDPADASGLVGNIGLAHAFSTPPTMALDIDDMARAVTWLADRGIDLDMLLDADDAVQIVSGREGSAKLVYRLPSGIAPIPLKQITDPATGDMVLEFRCTSANGKTVQDVLPPSTHPDTGKPYAWGGKGRWQKLPEIPKPLLTVWRDLFEPTAARPTASGGAKTATKDDILTLPPDTIQHLRSALLSMRADDYHLWINVGMALKRLGDVGRGLWLEWSLTSEKSQDTENPRDPAKTWEGFNPTSIDYRFIFAEAQRQGWVNPTKSYAASTSAGAVLGADEKPQVGDDSWDVPQSLPGSLRKVKELNVDCLPSTVQNAVSDISERLSCPADYVAASLLVGAGAIVGNRVGILPKQHDDTWEVYPAFWGGIVGPPGSMKTPVQHETMKPLRHIEEEDNVAYGIALATYQAAKKQYDKDSSAYKAGKLSSIPTEPTEPTKPRLVVNDTTYQALGEILAGNPRGVLIHGDELSGLLHSLDAAGQEAARGFYLSGWGGTGNYTFDRIGRGSIRLTHYAMSVFGGFQPDKIKQYVSMAQSGSSQNDGLLQRFQLLVWPDLTEDFVLVDRAPDRTALAAMNSAMLGLRTVGDGRKANKHGSRLFRFAPDAQSTFNKWYVRNEQLLRNDHLGASEQSHFAKYRSLLPGLALLFHLLEGHEGDVCEQCFVGAFNYAHYLKSHAQRIYGAVHGIDGAGTEALAARLKKGSLPSGFTARAVYTKGWRSLSDKHMVSQAVDQLLELGWLRERSVDTGGRRTIEYDINPRIFE